MTTGTQRANARLTKKKWDLDELYAYTPRLYPDTRQIRRQEARIKLKELVALKAKEERKKKRARARAERVINGETLPAVS